jgi:monoamine oxidase
MQRRDFLNTFLATLLGCMSSVGRVDAQAAGLSAKKRVVVIGAGLSGLAAARDLQQQGYEVVVVEARERIGGRIWTSNKWADMPLDFGATWIHGVQGNPLTALADQIQARRLSTSYARAVTYNTAGALLSNAEEKRMAALRTQVYKAIKQAQTRPNDSSLRQAIEPLMQQFPEGSEAYRFIHFILSSEVEQEYSGSAANLSSYWYDGMKEFDGGDALFVRGYQVITEFLAQGLHIELGQEVKAIQWQQSPVRVVTQNTEFVADQVVVTLPLGVLQAKRVKFTPELPRAKQEAIAKLGMGVLNKCYLRFKEAFWPADVDWLEHVSAKHGVWTEWVSFKRAANMPILLGFNAADQGRAIEAWTDQQIVASAMQTLRTIFGSNIPAPMDYQITRWASDPFALGSYSYNAVGSTPAMRKTLAAPVGNKLFFAGEASHKDYFATAHGAYLSGLRVAAEVKQA